MSEPSYPRQVPIAVVGVSALLPGCDGIEDFWRAVLTGRDLIGDVPPTHWLLEDYYDPDPSAVDKTYARRGAFLGPTEFDTLSFGIPPKALPATDTTQLLSLVVVERLLADAFGGRTPPDREKVGVVLGTAAVELLYTMAARMQRPVWLKALRECGVPEPKALEICDRIADHYPEWQEETFPGLLDNVVAGRIANRFDFHGANLVTDAACASSLAAMSTAVNQLALGQADVMITGGVDTANDILMYMCFSKTPAMSASGDCRPFSDRADGTVLGEGLVVYALKRLEDAERDGDRVYGVIKGMGSSSDGRGSAVYTPVPQGQARALRRAYQSAGYGPDTVEFVEAHGTGTKAGDAAEVAALREVFGAVEDGGTPRCALGSVKSQLGHLKSAAGAVGLLKALLAVNQGVLAPTAKVDRPNPELPLDGSALYVNTAVRPWVRGPGHPRRASVSSFGFGGSNFHMTVEEYVPGAHSRARRAPRFRAAPAELLPLSASSPDGLLTAIDSLVARSGGFAETARAAQAEFRSDHPFRLAVVARDHGDLARQAVEVRRLVESRPEQPFSTPSGAHYAVGEPDPGELCLLFPGQGSQYPGMGGDVAVHLPRALAAWDLAASVDMGSRALHEVVHPVPVFTDADREAQQELLTSTEWAQPALATHSLALLEVLRSLGVRPDLVAGHSLGELVALHAAGVLDAHDLVRLARRRGESMAGATTEPGAMLAVAAALNEVEDLLAGAGSDGLWVANHNGPTQVVVSGREDRIESFHRLLEGTGVRARRLEVSHAFHSPLVSHAGEPLLHFLGQVAVHPPQIPVVGNQDAAPYPGEPDSIRRALAAQLSAPVRFAGQVEELYRRGARTFVEVGAGSTLTNLVGGVLGDRPHLAVSTDPRQGDGVVGLFVALGRLAVAGLRLDFAGLWETYDQVEPERRNEKSSNRATVPILGANYGRPYPPEGGAAALPVPVAEETRQTEPEIRTASAMPPAPVSPQPARQPVPPPAPPIPAAPVPTWSNDDGGWWKALHESQRETALAHAAYQRAMAESHTAFLKLSEVALTGMASALNGNGNGNGNGNSNSNSNGKYTPEPASPPHLAPAPVASTPGVPAQHTDPAVQASAAPSPPQVLAPPPAHLLAPAPHDVTAPATASEPDQRSDRGSEGETDLERVLLSVVAERTGFPVEMLTGEMDLESDLGIDSIKRVEVLSALRERVDGLPDVDAAQLGKLRSLREIAEVFGDRTTSTGAGSAPAAAPTGPPLEDPRPIVRLTRRNVPTPAPGLRMARLSDGPVAVTADGHGVAEALAVRLAERGVPAEAVAEVPSDARAVVFLGGLREVDSAEEALAVEHEAFRLARGLAPRFSGEGGLLVTVQDTGGDFGQDGARPERAWLGGIAALARTAAVEWPDASVKAVDCERGGRDADTVARVIAAELLEGGPAPEVGLRADGSRTTPVLVPAPLTGGVGDLVGPDSVLVVSGGARGITARALRALAAEHRPRLLLLGRTPLADEPRALRDCADERAITGALVEQERARTGRVPTPAEAGALAAQILAARELRRNIDELRAAGSEVRYACVDVRDATAIDAELSGVRADWGPFTGVVHAAGALADRRLEDKTDEQFDRVFGTKVDGLRNLLSATATDPLGLVCVFSSVAAVHGNVGQCDYAMANEVLAHVASAEQAARPTQRVRSIAWGPWRGGMVTAGLAEELDRRGVALIDPAQGARAFVAELSTDSPDTQVVVVGGGTGALHGEEPRLAAEVVVDAGSHGYLTDHSVAGTPVLPVALVLEWFQALATAWRPGGEPVVVTDLKVVRKVPLPDLATARHRLIVRGAQRAASGGAVLDLELLSAEGVAHYRAIATTGNRPSARSWPRPVDAEPLDPPEVYDGVVLFHGPRFQVVRGLPVLSGDAVTGTVDGLRDMGWPVATWHTDPAAVDGALQLAGLWASRRQGGAWLPMSVGRFEVGHGGPLTAPAEVVVRISGTERDVMRCDIRIEHAEGGAAAEILDVVFVRRPDVQVGRVTTAASGEGNPWRVANR